MPWSDPPLSRRRAIAALLSAAALRLLPSCAGRSVTTAPAAGDAGALALLDDVAEGLLQLFPETATSLGIDT
ncbi:MAG TPA: hypothetical protein VEB59_03520, partial [Gemmatimonadales bacterium]|nr:hypothetical protein [Gemmatimonadales bacterium]